MIDDADRPRRAFLQGSATLAALAAIPSMPVIPAAESHSARLLRLTATEAVQRMSRGDLAVETYASALLARCESLRDLNAFIALEPQRVLEAARASDQYLKRGGKPGPLFGLPIPVKDSVNTADYPTTAGTPALRHFRPAKDAPVVETLRHAGAIVLGKTNLHELSYGWTSNNHAFGAVHNPYDPARIPGGSSGGTGAAIAARMAPLGIAEDTEGSIRVPAAFCGIQGFRPTTGRYSTQGCVPISPLFDQVGPHARSVTDLALFDSVCAGDARPLQQVSLQGVRIGVVRDYWFTNLDNEVAQLTEQALQRLAHAGAQIVETQLPGLDRLISLTTDWVQNHDVRIALAKFLQQYHANVTFDEVVRQASSDIQATFRSDVLPGGSNFVSEDRYAAARDVHLPALRKLYVDFFAQSKVAALAFPTTMAPATPIGEDDTVIINHRKIPFATVVGRNIAPGSTAGIPGLVLPAGLTAAGLPVGIEFDGPAGADRKLLELGVALEQALGAIAPPRI